MDRLRGLYIRGMFRWEPENDSFDTVGEAETYDFLANPGNEDAFDAAWALEQPWNEEADEWLSEVDSLFESVDETLLVALEQCCHDGKLLPAKLRALRLQRFPHAMQMRCEAAIKRLTSASFPALELVYWWVRIDRAQRTGCPDLDPARSLLLTFY